MKLSMPGVCSEGGTKAVKIRNEASATQSRTRTTAKPGAGALELLSRSGEIDFAETNMQGLLSGSYWPPDNLPRQQLSVPLVIP
jgi:hypothetical protein